MQIKSEAIVIEESKLCSLDEAIENSIKNELNINNVFNGTYISTLNYDKVSSQFLIQHPHLSHVAIEVNQGVAPVMEQDIGADFLITCDRGNVNKPILLQKIHSLSLTEDAVMSADLADAEKHILSAKKELMLKCGKSSITLTESGKVIIRGSYILSRSSGANKIKGSSIALN